MDTVNTTTARTGNDVLDPEQISAFHENGYLIADFGLDKGLLDEIISRVDQLYPDEYRSNPSAPVRLQDAWHTIDEVRQLAVHDRVLRALQQLLGRRPLPFQTLNFPVGTRQLPHSDTIHFNTLPAGFMAGVWVALEDIDADNGPLIYYPGSHRLPEKNMQDLGLESSYDQYPAYEQAVQRLIAEHGLKPAYGTIRKGEALIWHANLLHGGAPQNDPSRSRHSQVTHYFFEGCRYFTPLLSSGKSVAYRDPVWIPRSQSDVPKALKKLSPGLLARALRKLRTLTG